MDKTNIIKEQDWEERFLVNHIYPETSGFQKYGTDETCWKTDWAKVGDFIRTELRTTRSQLLQEIKERVEEIKVEEGHTEQCKDVLAMNYQIGLHTGNNDAVDKLLTIITSFKN